MAGYKFRNGSRDEEVVITVIATGAAGQARGLFAALKKEVLKKGKNDTTAPLPKYGDEQLRATQYDGRGPNVWATEMLVRKNTVVWTLNVSAHPVDLEALREGPGTCRAEEVRGQAEAARRQRLAVSVRRGKGTLAV